MSSFPTNASFTFAEKVAMPSTPGGTIPGGAVAGSDTVTQTAVLNTTLQTWFTKVTKQPTKGFPSEITTDAPHLSSYIVTAQSNANHYLSVIQPQVTQVAVDLTGMASLWSSFSSDLKTDLANGDYKTLSTNLNVIASLVSSYQTNGATAGSTLATFSSKVDTDSGNLSSSQSKLVAKQGALQTELNNLDSEQSSYHTAIKKDIAMAAGGGAAMLLGVGAIILGGATEIFTDGASTALIIAGAVVFVGGGATAGLGTGELINDAQQLSNVTDKINNLKNSVAIVSSYASQAGVLATACSNAGTQLSDMGTSWDHLENDLTEVSTFLSGVKGTLSSKDSQAILALLNSADKEWAQVGKMAAQAAGQLSPNSPVTTKNLNADENAFFDALTTKQKTSLCANETSASSTLGSICKVAGFPVGS